MKNYRINFLNEEVLRTWELWVPPLQLGKRDNKNFSLPAPATAAVNKIIYHHRGGAGGWNLNNIITQYKKGTVYIYFHHNKHQPFCRLHKSRGQTDQFKNFPPIAGDKINETDRVMVTRHKILIDVRARVK